jgi:L-fucose mutarotase/ribose pyranase (RbsD/FucU family)
LADAFQNNTFQIHVPAGGGNRRRYIYRQPDFLKQYHKQLRSAERIGRKDEPEAEPVKTILKPFTINDMVDHRAIEMHKVASERMARDVLRYQELMRIRNTQIKKDILLLEQRKFEQRKRNMQALMIILAEA